MNGSPIIVATGSNRVNTTGRPALTGPSRTGTVITTSIEPGVEFNLPNAGSNFYFVLATAPLAACPSGGTWNTYSQGTGLQADAQNFFDSLRLRNDTANAIVFSLFIGFGGYIDNRFIEVGGLIQGVLYSTYDGLTAPLNDLLIPDLSGTEIVDLNGNVWLAVQRTALDIFNADSGAAILLKNSANNRNVANVTPLSGLSLTMVSGDFRIKPPSANINGLVSEIYAAVKPSLLTPLA
jgi:hypothetical protein